MQRALYYVKRWAWLLLLCPVLAGGVTLVLAQMQPPVYEATVNLVFGLGNPTNPSYVSPEVAAQLGSTYTIMLESPEVLQTAAARVGLQETTEQLSSKIHAAYQSGSNIITLTADASSSDMATHLADAVVNVFREAAQRVSPLGKDVVSWGTARVNPVKLKGITFGTAGVAMPLGLLVALNVVALLYYLDDVIFTPEEAAAAADVPVLSAPLPQTKQSLQKNSTSQSEVDTTALLLLEAVRASVTWPATIFCAWASARDRNPQHVMRLANAAVCSGLRVVVINTDSHYPWLQGMYGLSEARGLGDALVSCHSLKSYILPLATPGLAVVPAGQASTGGSDMLLSPSRLTKLIAPLRQQIDLVLVTGAPILADPTAALTRAADSVILMAGMQRTRRADVREALATLHRVHARVLGMALGSTCEGVHFIKKQRGNTPLIREASKAVIAEEMREFN
ncbi:MAG TPA: hypothetical protein VKT82_04550 [Ktedonobacterales bacterium]|nr:hypothetical protein [Ktedonobacterales bacterium]